MLNRNFVLAGLMLAAAVAGMAQDDLAVPIVTGTVTYRQRSALPPVLTQGAPSEVQILLQQVQGGEDGSAEKPAALQETHWRLTELNGEAVVAQPGEREAYIELHADGDKLGGSGGCNRLFGSYDLSGSSLSFHSVAATLMACPESATAHEGALLQALKLTDSFQISGRSLGLRTGDRVLARFEARRAAL